jgi:hypothetical protein
MFLSKVAQAWAERLDRFDQAQLTVAQFCLQEAVSHAAFYKWRQRLRSSEPVNQTANPIRPPQFIPVTLPGPIAVKPVTKMTVELPGGIRIRFEIPSDNGQINQSESHS